MRKLAICIALSVAVLSGLPIVTPPVCVTDTLDHYAALSTGCTIGPLTFKNFAYQVLNVQGGATPNQASDITVHPLIGTNTYNANFTAGNWSVSGFQSVRYLLAYDIDPPPPIIRGMYDTMDTDPPVFPGIATITTDLCAGAIFAGSSVCPSPGTPYQITVFSDGTPSSQTTNGVNFTPVNALGVRNTIELDGNGASAVFTGLESQTQTIPEPMTAALMFAGLCGLAARRFAKGN
jgi:hypothetical protein